MTNADDPNFEDHDSRPSRQLTPEAFQAAQNALNLWNAGDQASAVQVLVPFADEDAPWALLLISWFNHQRGEIGLTEGMRYAQRAVDLGAPWVAQYFLNQATSFPSLTASFVELAQSAAFWGSPFDPVGVGINLLQTGNPEAGLTMMNGTVAGPRSPEGWVSLVNSARRSSKDINDFRESVSTRSSEAVSTISNLESSLKTRAQQLNLLLDEASDKTTQSLYQDEAKTNRKSSTRLWVAGIVVLAASVLFAVAPIAFHYGGTGPDYNRAELLGAHAGASLTLAAFAGVLLARSRARDNAREQAQKLAIAMGTMITYSQKIQDPGEQQSFLNTMGRAILESHLGREASIPQSANLSDEPGLRALLNSLRQTPPNQ